MSSGTYTGPLNYAANSNDEALKNEWQVEFFQDDSIVFTDIKDLKLFIDIIKRNIK